METFSGYAHFNQVRSFANPQAGPDQAGLAAFQLWFPELFSHYKLTMDGLKRTLPELSFPIPLSIFPGITVNFGGRVTTYRHRDINNLAYGICAVTPLGNFDHRTSAQLVLEEPKLVIEVPALATAFIMSGPCTHSNLLLAPSESCISFTQYAAGPIFQFAQNKCLTESALREAKPETWAENQKLKEEAWIRGVAMLPTIEKIIDY